MLKISFHDEPATRRLQVEGKLTGVFFFSSRRRHTRCLSDWSSHVCSSDLVCPLLLAKKQSWIHSTLRSTSIRLGYTDYAPSQEQAPLSPGRRATPPLTPTHGPSTHSYRRV